MQIDSKQLYNTDDLMKILQCGRKTVYTYIEKRKLPVIRLSRQRIMVLGSELLSWLKEQR
jgi:predicted DNA-binding transcriptional regulator AlpA